MASQLNGHRPAVAGAVVIGGDYQGLGIVRSLGRRGVPVCVLDDERSVARFSRFATLVESAPDLRAEEAVVAALAGLARRRGFEGWVLYPTRDETVAALARHRTELSRWYRVPTPGWEAIQWVWDKRNTYRRAHELGIPTPATWCLRDAAELDGVTAEPPYAVKPAIKEHFFYATKAKAWRANSRVELATLFARAAAHAGSGEIMVQDLIPGGGEQQFAYCAFFKDGRALASMTVRRRRQHPSEFGRASTFVETVEAPELEALSLPFLRSIGYYGLVEMEYKLDPRDGQFKLLDVNGRTWGYHSLGAGAGVDFSYLLYADQLGMPVDEVRAQPGIRWVRLLTDLPTGLLDVARGRQPLAAYWRSLRGTEVEAVFDAGDPWPGLAEVALLPYLYVKRGF